jgi:pyruvate formate lyase activating enzyme
MKMLITNIQRSSFHDGPGIRTTVFLKGCMLHCPWCANPETISNIPEYFYDESLCVRQGNTCVCNSNCPILTDDPIEIAHCPTQAVSVFGVCYSEDALYCELMKDSIYHKNGGGITFSGGEPFLQLHCAANLLKMLKSEHIHLCVETSLFAPIGYFGKVYSYFDLFYVDVKILLKNQCKMLIGGNIELFFKNLDMLFSVTNQVIFRIPLVENVTTTQDNLKAIKNMLKQYKPIRVEYFDIHGMAAKKYALLNKDMPVFEKSSDETKDALRNMLSNISVESLCLEL